METEFETCIGRGVARQCGREARDFLDPLFPMYNRAVDEVVGLDCDPKPTSCFDLIRGHRKVVMIVAPIVGVLVLAIIIAVVVACRRRRRRGASQASDKQELTKDDMLQKNLKFSLEQEPKEKSVEGGLKV